MATLNQTPNKRLEKELDKQFPKGDKARGRALVLFAVAQLEIDLTEVRAIREFKKESAVMLEEELKDKLKEKLRNSKEDWITTLRRELKEEMIDSL